MRREAPWRIMVLTGATAAFQEACEKERYVMLARTVCGVCAGLCLVVLMGEPAKAGVAGFGARLPVLTYGACCDTSAGVCRLKSSAAECAAEYEVWYPGLMCSQIECHGPGFCCCFGLTLWMETLMTEEYCLSQGGEFHVAPSPSECRCSGNRGDTNCDEAVDVFDIDPFVLAMVNQGQWEAAFGCDYFAAADLNCDGEVNAFDIDPFVACLAAGGCGQCD